MCLMELLTFYQINDIRVAVRTVRKAASTPGMEQLTSYQTNRTKVAVRTVKRDTAWPGGIELLTNCQVNRTRVAMEAVRRDTAGPGMESLTGCEAHRTTVTFSTMKRDIAITHSLQNQQDQSWHRNNEKENKWICYEITHSLLNQQYQSEVNGIDTVRVGIGYWPHMASNLICPFLILVCQIFFPSSKILAPCWLLSFQHSLCT